MSTNDDSTTNGRIMASTIENSESVKAIQRRRQLAVMNQPNPLGPRSERRRKNGGKLGVTRAASSKRLESKEAIRHIRRDRDAIQRLRSPTMPDLGDAPLDE